MGYFTGYQRRFWRLFSNIDEELQEEMGYPAENSD